MRLLSRRQERQKDEVRRMLDLDRLRDHKLLILCQSIRKIRIFLASGRHWNDFVEFVLRVDSHLIFLDLFRLDDDLRANLVLLDYFDPLIIQIERLESKIVRQRDFVAILVVKVHLDEVLVLLDQNVHVLQVQFRLWHGAYHAVVKKVQT